MQGRFDIREYLSDQGTRLNFLAKALLDADVPSILRFLETNPEVTSLNLENQKLLSLAAIEMLLGCRTLREINLSHIASERISHLALAKLVKKILWLNTDLKMLHLTHNNFNDDSMTIILDGIRENIRLSHLFVGNNFVEFAHFKVIDQALRVNRRLQVLHLNNNKITCKGAEFLAFGFMFNSGLQEINLSGNAIGDTGVIYLAARLKGKKSPAILLLRHNHISSHGAKFLQELFNSNACITQLDFSDAYVRGVFARPVVLVPEARVEPIAAVVQPNNDGGNNNNEAAPAGNPNHAQPYYVAEQFVGAVTPTAPTLDAFEDEIVVREMTYLDVVAAYQVAPQAEPPVAAPVHNHHANIWNRPNESASNSECELVSDEEVVDIFKMEF